MRKKYNYIITISGNQAKTHLRHMDNKTIAKVLEEIGVLVELTGGNPFRARAHYNAARTAESLDDPVAFLIEKETLGSIKGFGKGMVEKVTELLQTGTIREYEELKASVPPGLFDMLRIQGLGPKKVRAIYEKLGAATLGELEYACRENRLALLQGFGTKSQENVLLGIEALRKYRERHLYAAAENDAQEVLETLKSLPQVRNADIVGDFRRRREILHTIDFVASIDEPDHERVAESLASLPLVENLSGTDTAHITFRTLNGFTVNIYIVNEREYPFAFHYYTGSYEYIAALLEHAEAHGMRMNESGILFDSAGAPAPCSDEKAIFSSLNLAFIDPELRENYEEIEAASQDKLPQLLTEKDIQGILHVHTTFSDGKHSIEEMVRYCRDLGYTYIGICDHSKSAFYANGLSEERIKEQHSLIDELQPKFPEIKIFKGIESDILSDGSLDYDDSILRRFDFVVASVHTKLKMDEAEATERLVRAIRNPFTTILGHPTGRLLLSREGYPLNWDRIFAEAAGHGVAIELNAHPQRLDLDWRLCRRAKASGLKISVNPDAHETAGFHDMRYGIACARKGWLEPEDVLITKSAEEITGFFHGRKAVRNTE
ncbi:DNA polymerase/3'-5' exonuclease PolX [candidate division KSB1 bacterium]